MTFDQALTSVVDAAIHQWVRDTNDRLCGRRSRLLWTIRKQGENASLSPARMFRISTFGCGQDRRASDERDHQPHIVGGVMLSIGCMLGFLIAAMMSAAKT